jgi:nucleoside-diphosphate-sugar epimerase
MSAAKLLFIGGTGVISSSCVRRALELGHEVAVLNRGTTSSRPLPDGVEVIQADARDRDSMRKALGDREFDSVSNFIAFTPDHVQADIEQFSGRCGQYVFISSASAYQTPLQRIPILESTPLNNSEWEYSRNKIACENLLVEAHRENSFPATIVRPAHTYERTSMPLIGGWTTIDRMRRGEGVIVHGDGTSLWTLTHSDDFAHAYVGLLANSLAVGDSFHITSDFAYTWNQIYTILAHAAGAEPNLVHVSSEMIADVHPDWGPGLVGDKAHCLVFDNSKVKALVPDYVSKIPFERGAREIIDWYDADESRRTIDDTANKAMDRLIELRESARS